MKDLLKFCVLLPLYFAAAPALGAWLAKQSRNTSRWVFSFMLFCTALPPGKFTLFFISVETYRGHTKGYEGNLIEVLALALVFASSKTRYPGWQLMSPGAWAYFAWIALSSLSLFAAPHYSLLYATMALTKFGKAFLIYLGASHYLRDEEDLRWALRTLAVMLLWYAWLGLYGRYFQGLWQFKGNFEHQNPMAMWAYLSALPLLGVALLPGTSPRDSLLYLGGFASGALAIIMSVSRAGLGAIAIGSVAVLLVGWVRKPNARVFGITILGLVGAGIIATVALDSFRARLREVSESSQDSKSEYDLRDILNIQSRAMLADSPVGIGWNCFGLANSRPYGAKYSAILEDWDASRGFTIIDENYWANPLTESLYWLMFAETGYLGWGGFIFFIGSTLWFALRCHLRYGATLAGFFAASMLIGLGICYAHGLVERILTQTKNLSHWLLLCGLLGGLEKYRRMSPALARA
jgi:hypothetical protein